jgi:hypothetical protein
VKLAQCAKGRYAEASAEIMFTMQDLVAKHDCMSMHGDCFEAEILHERLQGIEANVGVVIKLRDPSLVDCRNGVETLGQNLPAEPRRGLKKCDVKKPRRKPLEQMAHHQPTRTASDDCQLNHAPPKNPMLRPKQIKCQALITQDRAGGARLQRVSAGFAVRLKPRRLGGGRSCHRSGRPFVQAA